MAKAETVIARLQERLGKLEVDLAIALTDKDEAMDEMRLQSTELKDAIAEIERLKTHIESLDNQ